MSKSHYSFLGLSLILFLLFSGRTEAQESKRHVSLGIRSGVRLAEKNNPAGFAGGIFIELPQGDKWSVIFEYDFWQSERETQIGSSALILSKASMFLGYNKQWDNFYIQLIAGPGMGVAGTEVAGGLNSNYAVTFEIAFNLGMNYWENFDLFVQFRKQAAAELKGNTYSPWLIGLGLKYEFK